MMANLTENLALIAAITALGAWWVSWREARRNNKVIVKLRRFSSAFTQDPTGASWKLEVWVVNRGIQLQNISMSLGFHGPGHEGYCSIPIPLAQQAKGARSTFLRGTTGAFLLSASDKKASNFLSILRDIKAQRPVINLYNNSFLACSFPIYNRCDRLRTLWNRLSFKFSINRRVGEASNGKGVFKSYQLPYFQIPSEKLQFFLSGLSQSNTDNTPPSAGGNPQNEC